MQKLFLPLLFSGFAIAACDGLFTGEKVARFPLQSRVGGYVPLTLTLGPEMNPVALNLQAAYSASAIEAGKWNSYRATLKKGGTSVASATFQVNNTSDPNSPAAQVLSRTMLIVDVTEVGDYELTIDALAPLAVTLESANVEMRRNIRRQETNSK